MWAQLLGKNSTPRQLTLKEIRQLVDEIPDPIINDPDVHDKFRENLLDWFQDIFRKKEFTPDGLEELAQELELIEYRSRIPAGTSAGRNVADTTGAGISQEQLDLFKLAGAKQPAPAMYTLRAILENSKNFPNPSMTIYFENRYLTFENILDLRWIFEETTLQQILHYDHAPRILTRLELLDQDGNVPWWHTAYETRRGRKLPPASYAIRLYLSAKLMHNQRITPDMVRKMIEHQRPNENEEVQASSRKGERRPIVTCVYSPMAMANRDNGWLVYMDIFPDPKNLKKEEGITKTLSPKITGNRRLYNAVTQTNFLSLTLEKIVQERIKGIPGIARVAPKSCLVTSVIKDWIETTPGLWTVYLKRRVCERTGIDKYRLISLFLEPLVEGLEVYDLESPYEFQIRSTEKPLEVIDNLLKKVKTEIRAKEKLKTETGDKTLITRTPEQVSLLDKYDYVFMETDGSNLAEVLTVQGVDTYRTVTNISREVKKLFGIEAALQNIDNTIYDTIAATTSRSRQSALTTMAILMTITGKITSLDGTGVLERGGGVFTAASIQKAFQTYQQYSMLDLVESVEASAVAVMTGRLARIGTMLSTARITDPRVLKYEQTLKDRAIETKELETLLKKFRPFHGQQIQQYLFPASTEPPETVQPIPIEVPPRGKPSLGANTGPVGEGPLLLMPALTVSEGLKLIPQLYTPSGIILPNGKYKFTLPEVKPPTPESQLEVRSGVKPLGLPQNLLRPPPIALPKVNLQQIKLTRQAKVTRPIVPIMTGEPNAPDEDIPLEPLDAVAILGGLPPLAHTYTLKELTQRMTTEGKPLNVTEVLL